MRLFTTLMFPLIPLLSIASASAAPQSTGGVIHFRGAIVEGGCEYKTHSQQLELVCPQGQKNETQKIAFRDITGQSFASLAKVEMHYLNPERSRAVVVISYN